jgi:hypothetical protein
MGNHRRPDKYRDSIVAFVGLHVGAQAGIIGLGGEYFPGGAS